MDVETLLRSTLAHRAADAPRAREDFLADAFTARSMRRRKAGAATLAAAAVVTVVAVTAASGNLGSNEIAAPAGYDGNTSTPDLDQTPPAPDAQQQQEDLAAYLGVENPPPVAVIRLVTPGQAQWLVAECLNSRGWGPGVLQETTRVDVLTGELATNMSDGGYGMPMEQQPAFNLDSYTCMASYPIDPAHTETSSDPYVRSSLIEAAGSGRDLPGYVFGPSTSSAATAYESTLAPEIAWVDGGDFIAVTTWGSSSCPAVPVSWTVDNGALAISTGPLRPDQDPCTADMNPYTVVFEVPVGIDSTQDMTTALDTVPMVLPPAT